MMHCEVTVVVWGEVGQWGDLRVWGKLSLGEKWNFLVQEM